MANTIKLKRGLSANIASASLVEGELALTTDTHELYTVGENNNKVRIQEELIEDIACGKAETIRYTVDASAIQETLDNLPLRLDGIVTININEGTGGDYNITIPQFYGNGKINITGCSTSNYEDETSVSAYELGQIFITGVSTIVNITGIKFKKISVSTCKKRVTIKYCHSNEDIKENAYNTGNCLTVSSCEDEVIFDNCTFDNKRSIIKFLDSNVKMVDCLGSNNRFLSSGQTSLGKLELKNNGITYEELVDEFWETDGSNALIISNGKIISEVDIDLKTINNESIIGIGNIEIPRGESGVYIGEEEPTDEEVNVWIDTDAENLVIPTKTSDLINDSGFITSIPSEYITETELEGSLGQRVDEVEYRFKKYSELKKSNSDEFDWSLMKRYFSNGGVLVFDIDRQMHHIEFLGTVTYNGYYYAVPGSMGFVYYNVNTSECTFTYLSVDSSGHSWWVSFKVVVDETTNTITDPDTYWYNTFASVSNCFTGDTLIYTPHGMRNIEDIKVGDVVYSYNEVSELVEEKKVTKVESSRVSEIYDINLNDLIVHTTKEHRFYCVLDDRKDYVAAGNMSIGTELFNLTEPIKLIKAESYALDTVVYNFEVEDNCNYFITNKKILVHNAKEII